VGRVVEKPVEEVGGLAQFGGNEVGVLHGVKLKNLPDWGGGPFK
jgi:hypothetical protein